VGTDRVNDCEPESDSILERFSVRALANSVKFPRLLRVGVAITRFSAFNLYLGTQTQFGRNSNFKHGGVQCFTNQSSAMDIRM